MRSFPIAIRVIFTELIPTEQYTSACKRFAQQALDASMTEIVCEPVAGGLINSSFKIITDKGPELLLQKINKNVFKKPTEVQENYLHIWNHIKSQQLPLVLPEPITCAPQQYLYIDEDGEYWRAFRFIQNSQSCSVASTPAQAFSTAATFAHFTASFFDFDTRWLHHTIPDFHNLSFRFSQLTEALEKDMAGRKTAVHEYVEELLNRKHYKDFFDRIIRSAGAYRLRVMHHDAKIANVLFDKEDGRVICAVDFDTVMPGYYFSDLGDMVRSMACSLEEGSTDFENIYIKKEIYDAILSGYLSIMKDQLTTAELQHIHHPGLIMIYMQAMRFLTDHINGDIYYKIQYEGQNLDRAKNQLHLLFKLEAMLVAEYNYELVDPAPVK